MNLKLWPFLFIFLVMKCLPVYSVTWATPIQEQSKEFISVTDNLGNIIELSTRKEGVITLIQAQTYHQDTNTWSQPIDLSRMDMNAHNPKMAIDPKGNAIAMWQITDGVYECIQSASYDAKSGRWTSTKDLSDFERDLYITHLAMNAQGNAFAAWKVGEDKNFSKTVLYSKKLNKWTTPLYRITPAKNYHQPD